MELQVHVLVLELGAEFKSADYILVPYAHIKLTYATCMYKHVLKKQKTDEEKDLKSGDVICVKH